MRHASRLIVFCCTLAAVIAGPDEIPDYRVQVQVSGVLRFRGNDQMAALLANWQKGFQQFHPHVQFEESLKGSATGIYGLDMRVADMALMGRAIFPYELYGVYERSWHFPVEIEVATGSADAPHKSPAYAILVHRDNPITQLTLQELDRIFGAQRGGGWKALSWDTGVARGPEANIRTWGQLGVTGPLADKPIHTYGQANLGSGAVTFFQSRVFGGGEMWNEGLREYADREQMIADLSRDPFGIAYAPIAYAGTDVKTVALAETPEGPFIALSRESVADRSYPLHRPVYIYYTIDNEKSEPSETHGDPRVKEFLRYILSRQGQADVTLEGSYLPLPPDVIREQIRKIESTVIPPERSVLDN